MAALWMMGFEDRPERSAEICVCEIFRDVARETRDRHGPYRKRFTVESLRTYRAAAEPRC